MASKGITSTPNFCQNQRNISGTETCGWLEKEYIYNIRTVTALHKHIPIAPLLRQYNLTILFSDLMAMSVTDSTHSHTQFVRLSYHLSRPWRRPIFRARHFMISSEEHREKINSGSADEETIHCKWNPMCSHSPTNEPYFDVHESTGLEDESNTTLRNVKNF